jgi:2-polyprenyl-3-methyl-5-hydroxy-6-metoxy-1,4-benzoquinol methylase
MNQKMKDLWRKDNKKNIRYFTSLTTKYGIDIKALDWGSLESQQLRFAVLSQVGVLNGTSVLDVGCGMGDFYNWLQKKGFDIKYTGIDITPKMIEISRKRFPGICFEQKDLLDVKKKTFKSYDYVFTSGIFTYRQNEPFDFLKEMVKQMFKICRKAIVFNSLSCWAETKVDGEFYADPIKTLIFCRFLTPWVVLRHDYHPRDFTIYMYKRGI